MELPVPVWDLKLERPLLPSEAVSDYEEHTTEKPLIRLPHELRVPSWSADENQKAPSFTIELLEENEKEAHPKIPQELPMLLPLFPWNVNLRFSADSGLLEPWSSSYLPLSRDLASPMLTSQSSAALTPLLSPEKSLAPSTPSQFPRVAQGEPEIPPGLSSMSESKIRWEPQLPTFGGIGMPQIALANQQPAFLESYQSSSFMHNSFPPPPRYDMQTAQHLLTTLESTAQPSYNTIASSVIQETRSVPADLSSHPASPTKRPRHTSDEKLQRTSSEASRLPPIPPLIPITRESGQQVFTTNGLACGRGSFSSSCGNPDFSEGGSLQSSPVSVAVHSQASIEIGSDQGQVFPPDSIVQSEVSTANGSLQRQVPPGNRPVQRRIFTKNDSSQNRAVAEIGSVLNQASLEIDSVLDGIFLEQSAVPSASEAVPDMGSIQDQELHDVDSIQDRSSDTTSLPPFVSSFPNHSMTAPLGSSRSTTESQAVPNPCPRREQVPVSIPPASPTGPRVSSSAPSAAAPPSNLLSERKGFEKTSPHKRLESSSSTQSKSLMSKPRADPSLPSRPPSTSTSSSLSTASRSQPGISVKTYERKRHIPLLPTPTFTSSRPPRSPPSTKYRHFVKSKNQYRVIKVPHSPSAPVTASFSSTPSSFSNRAAIESNGFRRPSAGSSEHTDSPVLKQFKMASRNKTWR